MTSAQFLQFANILPEPMLLVSSDGTISAVNRVANQLAADVTDWVGESLTALVLESPDEVRLYLHKCSRTKDMVLGALTFGAPGSPRRTFRAEGAVVRPRSASDRALVLLRLTLRQSAATRFTELNLRIEELGKEIHRRKQAEDAHRREEERLRVTLASIGDAVITTDVNGEVVDMNAIAELMTGWNERQARGRPLAKIFTIVNEYTRDPVANPAETVLREGTAVGLANHTVLISRSGAEHPIDDSAAPIRLPDGTVVGTVLVFRDVTERRRSEQLLRQTQEDLADFFENASVGLHSMDGEGIIQKVNQTELNMLGYSRDEYVGRHVGAFHTDPAVVSDVLQRLAGGEILREYPARLRCRDGSIREVLISASSVFQGGRFLHSRTFTIDVTERRRAERALRDSEARKAAIIESALDAIVTIDRHGRVVEFNGAAEALFGYSRAAVVGEVLANLLIPERYRELHRQGLERYLITGKTSVIGRRLELSALRKDGSEFPIELTIARVPVEGPPLFTAYVRDNSHRLK